MVMAGNKKKLAVFVSGTGTNCENIIRYFRRSERGEVALVLSTTTGCLAWEKGFLQLVPDFLLGRFDHAIINIHPALLPKFGGKGMYGHHVHEAVKAAGETETGMTVHWVTKDYDAGEIIAQFRVPVYPEDTPDDIAYREHLLEMEHFPKVIEGLLGDLHL